MANRLTLLFYTFLLHWVFELILIETRSPPPKKPQKSKQQNKNKKKHYLSSPDIPLRLC